MATYKELFFKKYANKRGNIKKGVKAIDVWNSIEEFLRIVLDPKNKPKAEKSAKVTIKTKKQKRY